MATLGYGAWQGDPNTKIPGLTHLLTMRVQLTTPGVTQTVPIPDSTFNPAQVTKVSPVVPNAQPQQGRRFFTYMLAVRDPAGVLAPAGTSGGGTVALINQTQANATVASLTSTPGASSPVCQFATLTTSPVSINPYDQLAITFTQTTGATSTAQGFSVDVFGYWQQGA